MPAARHRARVLRLAWAVPVLFALAEAAAAAGATVTLRDGRYDIEVTAATPAAEVIGSLAAAAGASIQGDPGPDLVMPNRLHGVSLEAAVSRLLPHRGFAISRSGTGSPIRIIFPRPSPGTAVAIITPQTAGLPPLSSPDLDAYVQQLPMFKTR